LKVVCVGEQFDSKVKVLAVRDLTTFVGVGIDVHVCIRGKKVSTKDLSNTYQQVSTLSGHTGKISNLLVIGNYLLSYSNEDKSLKVWEYATSNLCNSIELPEYYDVSVIMHPDTYLNKVLIGTRQGPLYLWNIRFVTRYFSFANEEFRTQKLIHTFDGWGSAVCTVVQSPAVDIVAVGLADGRIVLHNLKLDKTLFTFKQVGMVCGLSFRTGIASRERKRREDVTTLCSEGGTKGKEGGRQGTNLTKIQSDGHSHMVSGTEGGNIAVWNLEKRSLITQYQSAHNGPLSSLQFFEREPIMMTSGSDNSIKMWIFDKADGTPR
jgi:U3 small nucleolar RNA-associated protein 21